MPRKPTDSSSRSICSRRYSTIHSCATGRAWGLQCRPTRSVRLPCWITCWRSRGCPLRVRLVKGAYWDTEIKLAHLDGLVDFPVHTRRAYTDVAYLACAQRLLSSEGWLVPQFATHNARTVADVLALADGFDRRGRDPDAEFQRLH